jgi:trimethylamine:corrinoid methyltransferase-like protein
LFPDFGEQEVINMLKKAQDEADKIWKKIRKEYEKREMTSRINSEMRRKFKKAFKSYCM